MNIELSLGDTARVDNVNKRPTESAQSMQARIAWALPRATGSDASIHSSAVSHWQTANRGVGCSGVSSETQPTPREQQMHTEQAEPAGIEQRTIAPVPSSERHGRVRDLFTIWFGSNLMLLTIVTGVLATAVYGLPLWWAVVAIVLGNALGGISMALHSAQGPRLGVPQMIQSRGQFGGFGALVVVAVVLIMYVGFFASNLVLGGQSLHQLLPGASVDVGILLSGVVSLALCVFGYDLIHAVNRYATVIAGLVLAAALVALLVNGLPAGTLSRGGFSASGFVATLALGALWQIAYAPYVSDYSRYLPEDTPAGSTFWATYAGCVLGSVLAMAFGALIGAAAPTADAAAAMHSLTGSIGWLVVLVLGVGICNANAINLYGGVLSTVTVGQTFKSSWVPRGRTRVMLSAVFALVSIVMAVAGKANFLTNYTDFIFLLLYALIPWTAINLVDYYLIKRGHYDVGSFFRRNGGIYGKYNVVALTVYVIGILVEVPFFSTTLYTGPVAKSIGGADISWIVGGLVVCPLYYWVARRFGTSAGAEVRPAQTAPSHARELVEVA